MPLDDDIFYLGEGEKSLHSQQSTESEKTDKVERIILANDLAGANRIKMTHKWAKPMTKEEHTYEEKSDATEVPQFSRKLFDFSGITDKTRHPLERIGQLGIYPGVTGVVIKLSMLMGYVNEITDYGMKNIDQKTLEEWSNSAGIAGAGILGFSGLCILLGKHLKKKNTPVN